jgi:hypothetical protein
MPEMKEESKQWTSPGKQSPRKAKTIPSAGKVKGHRFLGLKHQLFAKGKNDHRAVL